MMSPSSTRFVLAVFVSCSTGSKISTSVIRSTGMLVTPSSMNSVVAMLVITVPSCTSSRFDTTTGMSTANVDGFVANTAGCSVNTPVPASHTAFVMPPENAYPVGVPNANSGGRLSVIVTSLNSPPK